MNIAGGAAKVDGHEPASSATDPLERSPYRHIPHPFRERCEAWLSSARNLVSGSDSFRYMSVENLMFAERQILELEKNLAREMGSAPVFNEPWLLMECSASSILWLFGLYEVTRGMKEAVHPRFQRWLSFIGNWKCCGCHWPSMRSSGNGAPLTIQHAYGVLRQAGSVGRSTILRPARTHSMIAPNLRTSS
jgi:hypothetical protein